MPEAGYQRPEAGDRMPETGQGRYREVRTSVRTWCLMPGAWCLILVPLAYREGESNPHGLSPNGF